MQASELDPLLSAIRRFVDERLIPLEAKVSEDDAIPADALAEMKALGLFGLSIPEAYGGLGLSMEAECRVMFEFCRCSPAFRSAFGTNVGIGSQGLVMFGTDAFDAGVQQRFGVGLHARTAVGCHRLDAAGAEFVMTGVRQTDSAAQTVDGAAVVAMTQHDRRRTRPDCQRCEVELDALPSDVRIL